MSPTSAGSLWGCVAYFHRDANGGSGIGCCCGLKKHMNTRCSCMYLSNSILTSTSRAKICDSEPGKKMCVLLSRSITWPWHARSLKASVLCSFETKHLIHALT